MPIRSGPTDVSSRPRDRERDGGVADAARRRARRGGRRRSRDGGRAGQRAEPGLRRLRGHAARVGGPAAREDARRLLREAGLAAQGFVVETGPVQAVKDALAQLEPPIDEIVRLDPRPERSGWLRRDVRRRHRAHRGRSRSCTSSSQPAAEGEANVLVIANQTVVSDELLDRIRVRAAESAASFLIVSPQSDEEDHADADQRLRCALTELRGDGHRRARPGRAPRSVHGRDARRERRARRRDHRLDLPRRAERLAAPRSRRSGCARTPAFPSSTWSLRHDRSRRSPRPATEPPPVHYSSRVVAGGARDVPLHRVGDHAVRLVLHGLLLRCASSTTLSTASGRPTATTGPRSSRASTRDPGHVELHDALGRHSIKRGNRAGLCAGHDAHLPARSDLPADAGDRVPPHRLQHERHVVRLDLLRPHRPARRCTSSSG